MLVKKQVDWNDLDVKRREEINRKDKEGLWMLLWSLIKVIGLIGVILLLAYILILKW